MDRNLGVGLPPPGTENIPIVPGRKIDETPPEYQPDSSEIPGNDFKISGETISSLLDGAIDLPASSQVIIRKLISHSIGLLSCTTIDPFVNAVKKHRAILIALTQSWLTIGAKACCISGDQALFLWPETFQWAEIKQDKDILWFPLTTKDQTIGHIGIIGLGELKNNSTYRSRLHAEALLVSRMFSLAIDLESARNELFIGERIRTEMEVAASIQIRLLPQHFPPVDGLEIYARCLPAAQVGGDFYSVHAREHRPFVFAVGDVSGKGLPAAFLMAMTRVVLHGAARFMPQVHPKAILSRINEDLYDDFTELGMFATVFTGCYDPINRQLSYANAGHSPVIYCPAGGSAIMLEADGPSIGVLTFTLSENFTMLFSPGDVLLIATDGLPEASNIAGEMFGYDRLLEAIEELAHLPADQITEELYKRVHLFAYGTDQSDDQTVLILKGIET